MPHVKFRTLDAGPKGTRHPGTVHEVTAAEAKELIEGRYAEAVDAAGKKIETAANPVKPEKR